MKNVSTEAHELLKKLSDVSLKGHIPAIGNGSPTVGMTLLDALGIDYSSTDKPRFKGIVVNGKRGLGKNSRNRVNLFAKVPNWYMSECKSSAEIVEKCGYSAGGSQRLYCTVRANQPNSQGLFLRVDKVMGVLIECVILDGKECNVASWKISELLRALELKHPETIWVNAKVSVHNGKESFHYCDAMYTKAPNLDVFLDLIDEGTVTIDHLIETKNGKTTEKGPLFKIKPTNISALFPDPLRFDLLSYGS